jgi:hypothetical protein
MDNNKAIEYAQRYFHAWPKVNEFFITSDGLAFFNRQDAAAHASLTRKDNVVVSVERGQVAGPGAASPGSQPTATPAPEPTTAEPTASTTTPPKDAATQPK